MALSHISMKSGVSRSRRRCQVRASRLPWLGTLLSIISPSSAQGSLSTLCLNCHTCIAPVKHQKFSVCTFWHCRWPSAFWIANSTPWREPSKCSQSRNLSFHSCKMRNKDSVLPATTWSLKAGSLFYFPSISSARHGSWHLVNEWMIVFVGDLG